MSYSAALEEMYASNNSTLTVLETLEVAHASMGATPARFAMMIGEPVDGITANVMLPLVFGDPAVEHALCLFEVIRPGADKGGPTEGRIRIDNVSTSLHGLLKTAMGYGDPFHVTFREYLVGPAGIAAIAGPDGILDGLEMQSVSLSAASAEGTIAFPDGRNQNVPAGPNATFDRYNYPTLFT